jgi:hypothetical protein
VDQEFLVTEEKVEVVIVDGRRKRWGRGRGGNVRTGELATPFEAKEVTFD